MTIIQTLLHLRDQAARYAQAGEPFPLGSEGGLLAQLDQMLVPLHQGAMETDGSVQLHAEQCLAADLEWLPLDKGIREEVARRQVERLAQVLSASEFADLRTGYGLEGAEVQVR